MSSKSFRKLSCVNLTTDFKSAVTVVESPLVAPENDQVLVKVLYAGVNATDINITAGRYFSDGKVPFDIGFEAVGVVEAVGPNVQVKVGQPVVYFGSKAFTEYVYALEKELFVVQDIRPEYIALLVCGLTAAIGLDEAGKIKQGNTVLITAAAGGTGHICVQWAKSKGCHVVGTCSSEEKVQFLKGLGCDRVINYKTEDIDTVLKAEYPKGIDVIWETIGGKVFETLVDHIAVKGRMVLIGSITGYAEVGFAPIRLNDPAKFILGSKTLTGFLLLGYAEFFAKYFAELSRMLIDGKLKVQLDLGDFNGIESIVRAEEHLHSGKNKGKVTVHIQD